MDTYEIWEDVDGFAVVVVGWAGKERLLAWGGDPPPQLRKTFDAPSWESAMDTFRAHIKDR